MQSIVEVYLHEGIEEHILLVLVVLESLQSRLIRHLGNKEIPQFALWRTELDEMLEAIRVESLELQVRLILIDDVIHTLLHVEFVCHDIQLDETQHLFGATVLLLLCLCDMLRQLLCSNSLVHRFLCWIDLVHRVVC